MKKVFVVALLGLLASSASAQQPSMIGTWLTASGKAQVRIGTCSNPANGPLCGYIVGLTDPKTGRWPYAVVQLRQENLRADSYNLVGFQNHLKYGEQNRVLKLIPGLENATFLRYGQIHRNTYIHAPSLLTETLQLKAHPNILIAGQLSGVEGYTESIASGMLAGIYAASLANGNAPIPAPLLSANGSLTHYITHSADQEKTKKFQPANITFDLLPPLEEDLRKKMRDKKERHKLQCDRALAAWDQWLAAVAR